MAVLEDTSLCAIVRDEIMNPAGGIERFVEAHVPYVEQAIIADTGSVDGTREKLEELQGKYSNLKVVDIPFEGYVTTRVNALKYVKTKNALVLDADELLTHEKPKNDWAMLKDFIATNKSNLYNFPIESISPNGETQIFYGGKVGTTRLFNLFHLFDLIKNNPFPGEFGEEVISSEPKIWVECARIKHFIPSPEGIDDKFENWYSSNHQGRFISETERVDFWKGNAPSKAKGFKNWKKYNFLRDNYI